MTGLAVLDLYAGSGALGLEALSRGAAAALFVESDQRTAAVLARNIEALGLAGATLRRGAVAAVLAGGTASPFDLILADPALRCLLRRDRSRLGGFGLPRVGAPGNGGRRGAAGHRCGVDLAGRLVGVARAGLRRHPFGVGRPVVGQRVPSSVMTAGDQAGRSDEEKRRR